MLLDHLARFFDWKRAVKAIVCLEHHDNSIKGLKPKTSEATNVEERKEAELFMIKLEEAFNSVIKCVTRYKEMKPEDEAN